MATKFCPQCGDEFLSTLESCPECGVELVEEKPVDIDEARAGQIEYELHEWAGESRVMLESLLAGAEIPRAWEGTDLVIPAAYEARVDVLIDQVEMTTEPNLDPEAPKVAYDLNDWTDEQQTELVQSLDQRGIPYDFDVDGSLVVLEDDDPRVEAILDELGAAMAEGAEPEALPDAEPENLEDEIELVELSTDDDEDEGAGDEDDDLIDLDAQEVMSDLFVAADRLKNKATDPDGVLTLVRRANDAGRMRLPYGFDRREWNSIVAQAGSLRDLLEAESSDDDEIQNQANELRGTLRRYV